MKTKSKIWAMRKSLIALCMTASTISSAWAIDEHGGLIIWGDVSCGRLTDDLKKGQDWESMHEAYLQGFVTGINAAVPGRADFFAGTDSVSRFAFVTKYCQENPLKHVINGIDEMVKQITGMYPRELLPPPPQKPQKKAL